MEDKNNIILSKDNKFCLFEIANDNRLISKTLESIDEAMVVFTEELNIYLWSESAEIKFGFKKDEIFGKNIKVIIPDDKMNEFENKLEILKQGKTIRDYITKRKDKEGKLIDVSISISPLFNCKGNYIGAMGIYRDIAEKINLENKLKESEERLRLAIEGGRLGLWDWNIKASTVYTSKLFSELIGYGSRKTVYLSNEFTDLFHQDDLDMVKDKTSRHFGGENFDTEFRMKCKDNNYKWFRSRGRVTEWSADGEPLRMIGIHEDITDKKLIDKELKEKYNQLKKLKEEAESANKTKSLFLANMSHEIRTPMNGIFGMVQLIESTKLNEEQAKYVGMIKDSINNLSEIINDILDISKIESGMLSIKKEIFDLRNTVNELYNNLLVEGNSKGLEISYYLDPNINFRIKSDELKLKQIINNLINNAVKFTDEGFVSFRTKIVSEHDKIVKIEFKVRDTGIGIDGNYKDKLFQYFSQDDISINKKYKGTGLGLAISKQIAELLNGDITFESKVGEGSTFIFTCEFEKIVSENDQQIVSSSGVIVKSNQNAKYTILCVEDNIINQEVLKNVITKNGYRYLPAYNGNEALELLKENKVDLILMDIQLPVLNGFEITKIIRNEYDTENEIPIIAITAYAMREDKEKCIRAGMNGYIAKPFELEVLYKTIEANLK